MTIDQAIQQAVALHRAGKFAEAENLYRQILSADPNHPPALHQLGLLAAQAGQTQVAIDLMQRAAQLAPSPQGLTELGDILQLAGRLPEAEAVFASVVKFAPAEPAVHANHATVLWRMGRLPEALQLYERTLKFQPDHAPSLHGMMNVLGDMEETHRALEIGRRLQSLGYDNPGFWSDFGVACSEAGDLRGAIAAHERAIKAHPAFGTGHYNLSQTLLLAGEFERGWAEHEWRWQSERFPSARRNFPQLMWDGSPTPKTVLVHAEQGFGDVVMFARYLPIVAARAKLVLECQPELAPLMRTVQGVDKIILRGEPLGPFDFHVPMLSLPFVLKTTAQTIPAHVPYVRVDPDRAEKWKARLGPNQNLHVGLVWAGSATHSNDRRRSMKLAQFAPLALDGVTFYSLQKGPEASQLASAPSSMKILDCSAELIDFADTAALISELDLLISVDTSPIHVAGALAKPVWALLPFLPDWRWLVDRPDDTPWYPTMRLFRQSSAGNWDRVIQRVAAELASVLAKKRDGAPA